MIQARDLLCHNLCNFDNRVYACDDCPLRTVISDQKAARDDSGGEIRNGKPRQAEDEENAWEDELDELLADGKVTSTVDPYLRRASVTEQSLWNNDEDSVDIGPRQVEPEESDDY